MLLIRAMMTLYQLRKCPWCAAVRQALENVGQPYRPVQVPYERDERSEVLRLTDQALVPVLVDGEQVLHGSRRVVAYLYEQYGDSVKRERAAELRADLSEV